MSLATSTLFSTQTSEQKDMCFQFWTNFDLAIFLYSDSRKRTEQSYYDDPIMLFSQSPAVLKRSDDFVDFTCHYDRIQGLSITTQ